MKVFIILCLSLFLALSAQAKSEEACTPEVQVFQLVVKVDNCDYQDQSTCMVKFSTLEEDFYWQSSGLCMVDIHDFFTKEYEVDIDLVKYEGTYLFSGVVVFESLDSNMIKEFDGSLVE